jgi:hypothetical protein
MPAAVEKCAQRALAIPGNEHGDAPHLRCHEIVGPPQFALQRDKYPCGFEDSRHLKFAYLRIDKGLRQDSEHVSRWIILQQMCEWL